MVWPLGAGRVYSGSAAPGCLFLTPRGLINGCAGNHAPRAARGVDRARTDSRCKWARIEHAPDTERVSATDRTTSRTRGRDSLRRTAHGARRTLLARQIGRAHV